MSKNEKKIKRINLGKNIVGASYYLMTVIDGTVTVTHLDHWDFWTSWCLPIVFWASVSAIYLPCFGQPEFCTSSLQYIGLYIKHLHISVLNDIPQCNRDTYSMIVDWYIWPNYKMRPIYWSTMIACKFLTARPRNCRQKCIAGIDWYILSDIKGNPQCITLCLKT